MKSWFSAAFMSSPKWTERRLSLEEYWANISLPPGNEWCVPPVAVVTSHGSRRVVTDMHVSRWPDSNWPDQAGKASIELYLAPMSSENDSRFIISVAAFARVKLPGPTLAKNCVLHPAT